MNSGDIRAFAKLLNGVMDYYRKDTSDFLQEVFWTGLAEYGFEEVKEAFLRHMKDPERGQFEPRLSDIVRLLEGTASDRSAVAWGKVATAMRQIGAWKDVVFDDAVIHAVVSDMGGWPKLCRTPLNELGMAQARFTKTYSAYCAVKTFNYPPLLGGERSADDTYAMRGLKPPPVELVGNPQACQLVIANGINADGHGPRLLSASNVLRLMKQGAQTRVLDALPPLPGPKR